MSDKRTRYNSMIKPEVKNKALKYVIDNKENDQQISSFPDLVEIAILEYIENKKKKGNNVGKKSNLAYGV